jgi:aspartate/methionine/tyrosine aminotransferase
MVGYLFVNEGDSIILPDLFWGNYKLIYDNTYGGQLLNYPFFQNQALNTDGFARSLKGIESKKKIVLLNFPNNPTGYTPSTEEAEEIKNILVAEADSGSRLLVVFDDAYFGLVYQEGIFRQSLFAQLAHAHENILAVKVDGATKEDYVWGFRIGFITFGIKGADRSVYDALEKKCAGAVRATISNASNLSQSLLLRAYQSDNYQQEKNERYTLLKTRYQTVRSILADHQEFMQYYKPLPYNSGYFMCVTLKDGLDAEEIRQHLLKKYHTGVIALKQHNLIRVAFASIPTHRLEQLFLNLYSACRDLSK